MSVDHSRLNALAAELGEEVVLQMALSYINAVRQRREGIAPATWSLGTAAEAAPAATAPSVFSQPPPAQATPPLRGVSWADRSAWFRRMRNANTTQQEDDEDQEDQEVRRYLDQHANIVID